jgi:uncharacterized membrane protein YhhN
MFRTLVKTTAIATLAAYAFLAGGPILLVAALAFSALGDFFLSRDGDTAFLAGMAAFFAAHLAYIPLFLSFSQSNLIAERWPIALSLLVVSFGLLRLLWQHLGSFRAPVVAYMLVIFAMGIAALNLPTQGAQGLILLGAFSFILSDSILAIEKFYLPDGHPATKLTPYGVWVFYWFAQVLILFGTLGST